MDKHSVASMLDSTLLKHDAEHRQLNELCKTAIAEKVKAVCVYPAHMEHVFCIIRDYNIRLDAVAGFPTGSESNKWREAEMRIQSGADEVDTVLNFEWFFAKDYSKARRELEEIVKVAKNTRPIRSLVDRVVIKVIIESSYLEDEERASNITPGSYIKDAAGIVVDSGADFVKTCTGMHPSGGVRPGQVEIIKSITPANVQIKAAGGIRNLEQLKGFYAEGARRFGTSSTESILDECE